MPCFGHVCVDAHVCMYVCGYARTRTSTRIRARVHVYMCCWLDAIYGPVHTIYGPAQLTAQLGLWLGAAHSPAQLTARHGLWLGTAQGSAQCMALLSSRLAQLWKAYVRGPMPESLWLSTACGSAQLGTAYGSAQLMAQQGGGRYLEAGIGRRGLLPSTPRSVWCAPCAWAACILTMGTRMACHWAWVWALHPTLAGERGGC